MGKWVHRILEVYLDNKKVLCSNCGVVKLKWQSVPGKSPRPMCGNAKKQWKFGGEENKKLKIKEFVEKIDSNRRPYRKHCGDKCERCGFIPVHPSQLHVHHKDYNHENNTASNLETLCANCHVLEHVVD